MHKGEIEKCKVLRPSVKKRLVESLDAVESRFAAARDSLKKGEEAEFLKALSEARLLVDDASLYSLGVVTNDCAVWCDKEDLADRIIQGIAAAL
ncbi:MAG: hypothetical protein A3C38_05640 [Planctomycetes bacterium RIFCSPHIGHO2_02_FULL_50_42]|nr:MAG: hypothetical protein A3C38_05640 [Planctomycetes bacterium RIFCSPHIGHO2_02_FULL_50_42]